ncbi:MAG: GH25 family lysozyme [Cellulosilyticaceae bacterium]
MKSRGEANIKGIDVSHWDGKIDYAKVKSSGVKVVYIKATEGTTYVDPTMDQNYAGAKAAGLAIGFYHFLSPVDEADAIKQAEHFVRTIKGKQYTCRLALDLEVNKKNLSKEQITTIAITFLNKVKELTGKGTVVYTYTSFVKENLTERLKDYRLWIAQYGVTWPAENGIWDSWIGFQSTEHGRVPGIQGDCDLDEFTADIMLK